ncbi:hypothetical protein [Phytohabitans suffuscus]|uniref:Uncharacterized protein n=1 Tax=Phytohabitans suffuscus TaxID=624315 RepID=A0A6F8YYP2_9ACTN|nr:hypothetical protein [Phytohabitans suffuscus]BCB91058.1 hypothetical protein Psuf_083710 [Phytohabitans suffuscus]
MEGSGPAYRHSFLVELWLEPRELVGAPALVRGRIRDLREERQVYVKSFAELRAFVEAALDGAGHHAYRWEGEP